MSLPSFTLRLVVEQAEKRAVAAIIARATFFVFVPTAISLDYGLTALTGSGRRALQIVSPGTLRHSQFCRPSTQNTLLIPKQAVWKNPLVMLSVAIVGGEYRLLSILTAGYCLSYRRVFPYRQSLAPRVLAGPLEGGCLAGFRGLLVQLQGNGIVS